METTAREKFQLELVDRLQQNAIEIAEQRERVADKRVELSPLEKRLKELQEVQDAITADLVASKDSDFQPRLPFPSDDAKASDPAGQIRLSAVEGITSKQAETLDTLYEVRTVTDLESFMAAGKFTVAALQGSRIGQTAVDKITDALVLFREANPIPSTDPETVDDAPPAAPTAFDSVEDSE